MKIKYYNEGALVAARKAKKLCIGCDTELNKESRITSADGWGYCRQCFSNYILDSLREVEFSLRVNRIAKDDDLEETWEDFEDKATMLNRDLKTYIRISK
jgi:hypothetical protein